jgi:acetylglutamate kinase
MNYRPDQAAAIKALRNAAPYIRMYKGKVFIVKVGGGIFQNPQSVRSLMEQIAILRQVGMQVVLVHGGGPQMDEMQRAMGIEPVMVDGRRVTCSKTRDISIMVLNGLLNTQLVSVATEMGMQAVGMAGASGGVIRAKRRGPVTTRTGQTVDYGEVGDIETVNVAVLRSLLAADQMPIISPLCCDSHGNVLNINADTVAAEIGAALTADKLLLCTGAAGIFADLSDPSTLVSYTDMAGLERLEAAGAFADGMMPKASAIKAALMGGVRRVHVLSFKSTDALLAEVFTNEGLGTLIVADTAALSPAEAQA